MKIPKLDSAVVDSLDDFPADEFAELMSQFDDLVVPSIVRGTNSFRDMAWRCQALANANLLRGQELLRFAITAISEGAAITAWVLTRAVTETTAAVIFARKKIESAIASNDPAIVAEVMDRLTIGNPYMARVKKIAEYPEPYSVMTMVDEAGKYMAAQMPQDGKYDPKEFRGTYEMTSETVHPSGGSFTIYQAVDSQVVAFSRGNANEFPWAKAALGELAFCAVTLLQEASALRSMPDLPPDWPANTGKRQ